MKFKATEGQVKQIFANAINASIPVGMGFLQVKEKHYTSEDIIIPEMGVLDLDYFEGRMVKLAIKKIGKQEWEITRPQYPPRIDYQSWVGEYHTLDSLIGSVV